MANVENFMDIGISPVSGILGRMTIDPEKVMQKLPPQEYIDGVAIPMNNMSFLYTDGGSGKSTGARRAGIEAAANGHFKLLGERYHSRPLRVVLIFGEETEENIIHSIQAIPGCIDHFKEASAAGRIAIVSMLDCMHKLQTQDSFFGEDGGITDFGREVFASIAAFKPDLFVIDTLTSVSDTEYLDGSSAKKAIRFLNSFCSKNRCAGLAFGHLGKGASAKITSSVTSSELLSIARGSAQLPNVSRHFMVMVKAPSGMYDSSMLTDDPNDEIWIGTAKTNLQGCPFAFKIFPAIRDASEMTLSAVVEEGVILKDRIDDTDAAIISDLEDYIECLVRLAAESLQPFAESGKMSPGALHSDLLAPALPPGVSKRHVDTALERLIRSERVKVARVTATGTPLLDVDGGPFASPELHLDEAGKPPRFRKGAPDIGALAERLGAAVQELREARERGR